MAILDRGEWKRRTKRGLLTPRSSELEAIDRAMATYYDHPGIKALTTIKEALDAWIAKKGVNWSDSTRNTNGAVDELKQAVESRLGGGKGGGLMKEAKKIVLDAPPPVAKYPTMTDDLLLTEFAQHALSCFKNHWNKSQPVTTGQKLLEGITDVHQQCNIPAVGIDIKALPPGYNGFFAFSTWTIEISTTKFSSYDMVWTDSPANTKPHPWFVTIAETLYHEARHCEQWWHMARYCALGNEADEVAATLGIPLWVAQEAKTRPMKHKDPLMNLTKAWYESVYGGSKRGVVLHALALKRTAHASPKITPTEKGGGLIHEAYSGDLAEEVDAWAIQTLLRAKFPA
jgi:hypothetical protein